LSEPVEILEAKNLA